ncbi:sedoheptulose 7-phosphate isomerase [Mycobacterium haemophilum DSM 44634]|uniref:HypC/HybG/HupF family hydrogenase formation chaperone n=1 Tax=Mycobacterium haemophilum TaxID=29311 RepID=UPI0006D5C6EE|nr:HypC/HybG/HupF family hydrogenase formation chaperone [Mycobacterium haemophilum]MCV7340679.1 hydrogenase assembly protein HupF [Mycobacterium haemophilum DSM 44634]
MTITVQPGGGFVDIGLSADLAGAALDLSRRFHDGATLWVMSPQWEPHAHHVAVEFVHPVIMGKRALPSAALVGPDPVAQARVACRAGDVLMAVASADEPAAVAAMRRAPAWGALTLWVGAGPRPAAGAANHVLWIDSNDPMVPVTGQFVLLYHLLWELTHVCFEHPGLLTERADGAHATCVTCSDEGRMGEIVLQPIEPTGPALVRTATGEQWVDVSMLSQIAVNDLVLVHAGAAIARLDDMPQEANR